ncbi:APC family permease [Bacillus sp. 1P06AnD]|uniref:APC family permease n=1 Tax=Bacillus sp. 1P06AnD TaxID=3132208 RepID=UPI0039A2CDD4
MKKEKESLERSVTLVPLVLFGLAYMAPMIVFGTYGVLAETTKGVVPTAYIIALIAMLFTANSYGKMVKAFPVSGSAYTYTRKSISSHLGFMVGWSVLLDYLFLPLVIWLIGSVYLQSAFPDVPAWIWIISFIVITTAINIIGIKMTTNVNFLMMLFQFLVIAIFIVLSIISLMKGHGTGTLFSSSAFVNSKVTFSLVVAGASVACYSFLGFDAVTTMSEETVNPTKTVPRAISLIAMIGGAVFILTSYVSYLVYPHYQQFKHIDAAGSEIAFAVGGNLFSAIFLAGLIIAQFASGLTAQTSAARLLFAMGRDSVLPKKFFGYIHPRFRTPILNLLVVSVVALLALKMDVSTSTSFINFGAFVSFTFVNLSVIGHYFVKEGNRSGKHVLLYLLVPLLGAFFDIWLLIHLDKHALILGSIWTFVGFVYLIVLTRMFRREPPELSMDDKEAS